VITDIETDPRHGLQVQRYHTWPTIRKQSVGEHSAQIARIMLSINPDVSRELLVHAIEHDVGEMAGDVPWPGKANDPELKRAMDRAEGNICRMMQEKWHFPQRPQLSEFERKFFKMCENIEMYEFALQEQNLGNRYARVVATRMLLAAGRVMTEMPEHVQTSTQRYMIKRDVQEMEEER